MEAIPFDRLGKPQSFAGQESVYALGSPIARKDDSLQADEFVEMAVSKCCFRSRRPTSATQVAGVVIRIGKLAE